jgi:putative oxidoreductase
MDVVFLIGRILFVYPFVWSGLKNHFSKGGVEYARSYGVPAPELTVPLAGVGIILGSLLIVLGIWGDLGALMLIVFLIPTTYYMHAYWKEEDPRMRVSQEVNFVKNTSMLGAAAILFYLFNQFQGAPDLVVTDPLFDRW